MMKQDDEKEIDPIAEKMKVLIQKLDQENEALQKIISSTEIKPNNSSKPKSK